MSDDCRAEVRQSYLFKEDSYVSKLLKNATEFKKPSLFLGKQIGYKSRKRSSSGSCVCNFKAIVMCELKLALIRKKITALLALTNITVYT